MTQKTYKQDFPIFKNNPGLVFLDSGASSQKPKYVIDGVSEFTANSYANIHRGYYDLSEQSEEFYDKSKALLGKFLNCKASEIIYTYNSTYGFNLIAQSLTNSSILKPGDTLLLGIREHHANIVPWQILSKEIGFNIKFIDILDDYSIDREDFDQKYDETVSVVSLGHVSNVTGQIYDMQKIKSKLRDDTFFIIDASQSFPHMPIDVSKLGCDCLIITGHKAMAYTGIGAVYLKRECIKRLKPMISGGGTVKDVSTDNYLLQTTSQKFEAGTPNIIGAVSLLKALEYIQSIGGIETIWKHEQELVNYTLPKFAEISDKVKLVGSSTAQNRIAVFSFYIPEHKNFNNIGELFAEQNIAIRCGGHCAYPLHKNLKIPGTCRASAYLYNDKSDIDRFFEVLKGIIN